MQRTMATALFRVLYSFVWTTLLVFWPAIANCQDKKARFKKTDKDSKNELVSLVLLQSKSRKLDEKILVDAIKKAFPNKKVSNHDDSAEIRVVSKDMISLIM
jgi:hypothetical protein